MHMHTHAVFLLMEEVRRLRIQQRIKVRDDGDAMTCPSCPSPPANCTERSCMRYVRCGCSGTCSVSICFSASQRPASAPVSQSLTKPCMRCHTTPTYAHVRLRAHVQMHTNTRAHTPTHTRTHTHLLARGEQGDGPSKEQELQQEQFMSALPFLPPLSEKTLGKYYYYYAAFCFGIIAFGALVAPILEFKMGVGGGWGWGWGGSGWGGCWVLAANKGCVNRGWVGGNSPCTASAATPPPRPHPPSPTPAHRPHLGKPHPLHPWPPAPTPQPPPTTPRLLRAQLRPTSPHHAPVPAAPAGTSYLDFVESVHLPRQLAQVDPIVASFCGGAVGVISALLVIEINNIKQQQKNRCAAGHVCACVSVPEGAGGAGVRAGGRPRRCRVLRVWVH